MIPYIFVTIDEFKKIITLSFSWKRYLFVFLYYIFLTFVGFLLYRFEIWKYNLLLKTSFLTFNIGKVNNIGISFIFIFLFFYFIKSLLINVPKELNEKHKIHDNFRKKIAILIACHNSQDVIEDTLESIVRHFPENQVFVCDNNKHKNMSLNEKKTQSICKKYKVNYNYINIPNKTNAIRIILKKFIIGVYEYTILLDDDTLFAKKFCPKEDWFLDDNKLAGIGFSIRMKNTNFLIQRLVDYEYLMWSYNKFCKNYSTNKMICGIAGIWRTNIIYSILKINPAGSILPFGEDGWNGLISRLNGYKIKQDFQNFVYSFCPTKYYFDYNDFFGNKICNISGYDATNLWKQRSLRWYRSSIMRFSEFYTLFYNVSDDKDNLLKKILSNIYYRFIILWSYMLIYIAISVPFLLIKVVNNPYNYLVLHTFLILSSFITNIYVRLVVFQKRDDCKVGYDVIFFYPFFLIYTTILKSVGFYGTVFYYFPFKFKLRLLTFFQFKDNIDNIPKPMIKEEGIEIIIL